MAENAAMDTTSKVDAEAAVDTDSHSEASLSDDLRDVIDRLESDIEDEPTEQAEPEQPQEETQEEIHSEAEESPKVKPAAEPKSKYAPPVNWSPKQAEQFATLPEDIQRTIHDREVQIATTMQNTAHERRLAQSFMEAVQPFRGLMEAEGVQDPIQAVRGLMSTTAQLAMGTQAQKAQKIAALINHYGIDIQTLDSVLAGEQPPNKEDDRIQQMINQRLAPFDQMMQQMNQQRQQAAQRNAQEAQQSVEQFGADEKNEFFPHVRHIMADFMEIAANNNQEMSLQEAYDRACWSHPEIREVITKRQLATAGQKQNTAIGGKRNAASSVHGSRSGDVIGEPDADDSIRGILETQIGSESGRI